MGDFVKNRKVRIGLVIFVIYIGVAVFGPLINQLLGIAPRAIDFSAIAQEPSLQHPLGTTSGGENVLAQVIEGTRGSVFVGVTASLISTSLAILVGVIGGFLGGRMDSASSFLTNLFIVIPTFPLTVVIAGYLQGGGLIMIAIVVGAFGWAAGARTLRSQTLSLRSRDYVTAMKSLGEGTSRLVFVEVLPHLAGWLSAMILQGMIGAVMAEASLSFLGITSPAAISWGTMIEQANSSGALLSGLWWWFIPPGICIAVLGFAVGMINFGIDEVTNPRVKATRTVLRRLADERRVTAGPKKPTERQEEAT